jgi:hypothetical protein
VRPELDTQGCNKTKQTKYATKRIEQPNENGQNILTDASPGNI